MKFICYTNCSACKKAEQWLLDNGFKFKKRDIKTQRPSEKELREWYEESGLPLKRFFNTSGLLYKALELKDQLPDMSETEQLRLLASDGMLVKRPIILGDNGEVLVGFNEEAWEALKK